MCTTDAQQARFQQRTNLLMRRIEAWHQIQDLFMPGARILRDEWTKFTSQPRSPEDLPLFLPSQIHDKTACPRKLEVIEF